MVDLLAVIKQQAALYETWTEAPLRPDGNLGAVEMAFHRMNAAGMELLKALMLWLLRTGRELAHRVLDAVDGVAESCFIRRQLLRLAGSDLRSIVAKVIRANSDDCPHARSSPRRLISFRSRPEAGYGRASLPSLRIESAGLRRHPSNAWAGHEPPKHTRSSRTSGLLPLLVRHGIGLRAQRVLADLVDHSTCAGCMRTIT
jgi:hypothetical protein